MTTEQILLTWAEFVLNSTTHVNFLPVVTATISFRIRASVLDFLLYLLYLIRPSLTNFFPIESCVFLHYHHHLNLGLCPGPAMMQLALKANLGSHSPWLFFDVKGQVITGLAPKFKSFPLKIKVVSNIVPVLILRTGFQLVMSLAKSPKIYLDCDTHILYGPTASPQVRIASAGFSTSGSPHCPPLNFEVHSAAAQHQLYFSSMNPGCLQHKCQRPYSSA